MLGLYLLSLILSVVGKQMVIEVNLPRYTRTDCLLNDAGLSNAMVVEERVYVYVDVQTQAPGGSTVVVH